MFSIKIDLNYGAILKFIIYHSLVGSIWGLCNFAVKKKALEQFRIIGATNIGTNWWYFISDNNISALVFSELVTTSSSATWVLNEVGVPVHQL